MVKLIITICFYLIFINFKSASAASSFEVISVKESFVPKRILLGGTVVPVSEVKFSAQVSGDIIAFKGNAGDFYQKGDLIVSLEQDSLVAKRESANAEIEEMEEVLKNAKVQYNKSIISPYADSNNMFGGVPGMFSAFVNPMRNVIGQGNSDFEKYAIRSNSYSKYATAGKRLKKAYSKLKETEAKLADTSVKAPFDGVLVKKIADTGDSVQQGNLLFTFANINQLQLEFDVPSRLLFSLRKGKKYRVRLDISNYITQAILVQIYPLANKESHTVKVKFNLPTNSPAISGSYAELELFNVAKSKKTPIIAESSLVWRSSIPSVFVINKDNQTELRFVRIGDKVDSNNISILSGLKFGERVVSNPSILMKSGMSL